MTQTARLCLRHRLASAGLRIVMLLCVGLLLAAPLQTQDDAGEMLSRVNSLRASVGLPPYQVSAQLSAAAMQHAQWMAATGQATPRGRKWQPSA